MPSDERSPLLSPETENENHIETSESAPLLADQQGQNHTGQVGDHDGQPGQPSSPTLRPRSKQSGITSSGGWRWPSIISGVTLSLLVIAVLVAGFLVPGAVKQYAESAAIVEPTSLSVESITSDGVRARIQANFRLDGSRVGNVNSRRIGRFATGIMRKLETDETQLNIYLPHYNNSLLGSAVVPPLTVDIVDGHKTEMDFVTDLNPGDAESIRKIANNWLDGKLDQLKVTGSAAIGVKSGIIPLGTHDVVESMVFEANKTPSVPDYKIERLNFHDVPLGLHGRKAVGANVSLSFHNDHPVGLNVPPLGFEILLANCDASEPYITVAEVVTDFIKVRANSDVVAGALGIIRKIPESLTQSCPRSKLSPLDHFMEHYLHGEDAEVYVRGNEVEDSGTPEWITSILQSVTVPIEFPGRSFGDTIRNFSVADVDFKLPSPFADPSDPDAVPRVSGSIEVLAALPGELNVELGVKSIRSNADLYYENQKVGELNLRDWQDANSTKVTVDDEVLLNITTHVVDVPLNITDNAVFTDVIQKMLFGDENVLLDIKAVVDVQVGTVLGHTPVNGLPANGTIPVKPIPKDTFKALAPLVDEMRVLNTSDTGVRMQARVNFTNPTPYTAFIPHLNMHILQGGRVLGEVIATDVNLQLRNNTGNMIQATWDPLNFGGVKAQEIGRRLLSAYLSGKNTTLEVRTHRDSVPAMPLLGEALSTLNLTIPTPHLRLPGDDDDNAGDSRFIRDATFHLFSSTATFTLASPLHLNTVYLDRVNATAFYNHTEPVGRIVTDKSFTAPPGLSQTPRLPVMWSPGHIGYDKLKEALGGRLKLDAVANVTLRIGNWVQEVHYVGHGLGAKVSI